MAMLRICSSSSIGRLSRIEEVIACVHCYVPYQTVLYSFSTPSLSQPQRSLAVNVNLAVCGSLTAIVRLRRRSQRTIFPLALPAAARVDVLPEVVPDAPKLSVICFVLVDACAGLPLGALLPV